MGLKTDSIKSSIVEEELTETNRTCPENPDSMLGLAYNTTSVSIECSPVGTLAESRDIFVSNKTNETHAIDIGTSLEKVVPNKTTENESVAEKITFDRYVVESTEPCENSTEILALDLTPLTRENKIIASVSVESIQEHVKNLDISKETKGLPSPNKIEYAMKQTDALEEKTLNEVVHVNQADASRFQFVKPLLSFSQTEGNHGFQSIRPIAPLIHPQDFCPDPFQNELIGMITKTHEQKMLQLKLECDQELEKVHKKYDALLQKLDSGYNQEKEFLDTMYSKVLINRILAEKFRSACFIDTQGCCSTGPTPPAVSDPVPNISESPGTSARHAFGLSANLKRKRLS